jgi:hypothetical protein
MSNSTFLLSAQPAAPIGTRWAIALVLAVWFGLVVAFGAAGAFVTPPGTPPLPIALGVGVPLVLFFAGLGVSRAFRDFVAAIDVRLMLGIQAWRFAGLGFLALYTYDLLPGGFALPAGLGDIAIGVTAPWVLLAVVRQARFIVGKTFAVWNALGMLDLVVAVGTGTLISVLGGVAGEVTMTPMAQLPLLLVPVYFVPILMMLHVAALMQARRAAAELRTRS